MSQTRQYVIKYTRIVANALSKIFAFQSARNAMAVPDENDTGRNGNTMSPVCNAPYSSMYFDFRGEVFPCCENTSFMYGKYPNQSVREIWFGNQRKHFSELMSQQNLNHGCYTCKQKFEIGLHDAAKANLYKCLSLNKKYPEQIEFKLSNLCNLECFMCDERSSSKIRNHSLDLPEIENPYDDEFVNQLIEFIPHLKQAHFVGGEPFLIPVFYKIWHQIAELNPDCLIIVQTNATILNENIKFLLSKARFSLNISLDSVRKNVYDRIRKGADFDKTIENINYFIDYSKQKGTGVTLTVCPMQQNWEEMPDLVDFANQNNIAIFFNTVVSLLKASLLGFSNEKLNAIYDILSKKSFPNLSPNERTNRASYQNLLLQIQSFYTDKTNLEKDRQVLWDYIIKSGLSKRKASLVSDNLKFETLAEKLLTKIENITIDDFGNEEPNTDFRTDIRYILSRFQNDDRFIDVLMVMLEFSGETIVSELTCIEKEKTVEIIENILNGID